MNRVFAVTVFAAFALLGYASRADAAVELCPAAVSALHPLDGSAATAPATTFAFDLDALSAETVRGAIAVETDKGWYEVPFGPTTIAARNETYAQEWGAFSTTNYASAALVARFPLAVTVKRAFVFRVTTDDTVFPWPTRGEMTCDYMTDGMKHDGKDGWSKRPELFATSPEATQLVANPSTAFANLPCAAPFVAAKIVNPVAPDYPVGAAREQMSGTVIEAVVLDEHGSIVDQWMVSPPSWYFDGPSNRAAHQSTYAPPISFCKPVRSVQIFHTDYRPD